jgi:ABC-type Mn2+/Zn2+ transport system permease subunit
MTLTRWLTEPLSYSFFIRGILAAVLVLIGGAMLGFGVLVRRSAYLGQGISQSMLAGVAIGAYAGVASTIAAFTAAVIAAIAVKVLSRVGGIGLDASIAVVTSAFFSIGVALISADRSRAVNLNNLLFGNVLGVSWGDVIILAVIIFVTSFFTLLFGRKLALAAIAPQVAEAHGIDVKRIEMLHIITLAMVTAASVQVVGVTLVVAALVIPAAIGLLCSRTLGGIQIVAIIAASLIGVSGLFISYWSDLASGPAVVITGTVFYIITLLLSRLLKR